MSLHHYKSRKCHKEITAVKRVSAISVEPRWVGPDCFAVMTVAAQDALTATWAAIALSTADGTTMRNEIDVQMELAIVRHQGVEYSMRFFR